MHLKIAAGLLALFLAPIAGADTHWNTSTTSSIENETYEPFAPIRRRRGRVACFAENRRGQFFRAVGRNPRRVQRRAMQHCFQYSRYCRPMGCRSVRW